MGMSVGYWSQVYEWKCHGEDVKVADTERNTVR